jgi:hypothetical protein
MNQPKKQPKTTAKTPNEKSAHNLPRTQPATRKRKVDSYPDFDIETLANKPYTDYDNVKKALSLVFKEDRHHDSKMDLLLYHVLEIVYVLYHGEGALHRSDVIPPEALRQRKYPNNLQRAIGIAHVELQKGVLAAAEHLEQALRNAALVLKPELLKENKWAGDTRLH